MSNTFKSALVAAAFAAAGVLAAATPAQASPAASGIASSGITGIAADASQVQKVHRRGRRHRHRYHGGPAIYFGFGAPYYYGSPYYYTPRPRYRRYRRGGGRCGRAHRACVRNWGYGGGDYEGCMRYEGCRPR
jgi:hypothetical protein